MPETVYYFKREGGWYTPWILAWSNWKITEWPVIQAYRGENRAENRAENKGEKRAQCTWPIITLITFFITLVANIAQAVQGVGTVQKFLNLRPWIIFLYPLKLLGLDTLRDGVADGILTFIISFMCLGGTEIFFLSHSRILFFLLVDTMFAMGQWSFLLSFCRGEHFSTMDLMLDSYCCSSFLMSASMGLVLICIRLKMSPDSTWIRNFTTMAIGLIWALSVINDYFYHFDSDRDSIRVCESFSWHAMNYLFGIVCGVVLV